MMLRRRPVSSCFTSLWVTMSMRLKGPDSVASLNLVHCGVPNVSGLLQNIAGLFYTERSESWPAYRLQTMESLMHHISKNVQSCVDECTRCAETCLSTAMGQGLEAGAEPTKPEHFRLMIACAEICRSSAAVMLTGVELHTAVCAACAELCEASARSCEQVGGMDECVKACRSCAASCRKMSGQKSRAA
jgi:hypothetical protein